MGKNKEQGMGTKNLTEVPDFFIRTQSFESLPDPIIPSSVYSEGGDSMP